MRRPHTGLYTPQPRVVVIRDLVGRSRRRFDGLSDDTLGRILEDALYNERKRLDRHPDHDEEDLLDDLAQALIRGSRAQQISAGLALVARWADEIHGHFDLRVYRTATSVLPKGLTALLSPPKRGRLRNWNLDPAARLTVDGNLPLLRQLASEATLLLAPTHVSNLDSPAIGLALHLAGLPPFVYGAGLNLFSNPVMGWWMHRLGAYTVDRTKRALLYKDVLKDYSIRALTTHHHSLFFPGGTRSRSGRIETRVKKGLLGTGVVAWQEMLKAGRKDSEIYVVPLTLSFQLVLEANTLIQDHLAEAGKQRYIITDDEFAQPRQLLTFANRLMELDAAVVARFGQPMDLLGRPVPADASERREQARIRRAYVCDRQGEVESDPQRDRMYTQRLADALVKAWPKSSEAMATHVGAYAAWSLLEERTGTTDPFRIVQSPASHRRLLRHDLLTRVERTLERLREGAAQGRWHCSLGTDGAAVLDTALERFTHYHRSRAIENRGSEITVSDPRLCLYYRNRLAIIEDPQ